MRKTTIPSLVGILILMLGVFVGVFFLEQQQVFKLGASPETTPKNVEFTNVSENSLTISWVTDAKTIGFIKYGDTLNSINNTVTEENNPSDTAHSVTITNLAQNTNYYFEITSAGIEYDNNGQPWVAKTTVNIPSNLNNFITGTIIDESQNAVSNAIVYASNTNTNKLSTKTSSTGSFVIAASFFVNASLSGEADLDNNSVIDIYVQKSPSQIASAKVLLSNSSPIPQIEIGKFHDFTSINNNQTEIAPDAEITLPAATEKKSKFEKNENLNLEVPEVTLNLDENEILFENDPTFSGEAPIGTEITITVQSTPQTENITTTNGNWNWSPPQNLEEGNHTITVSWRDSLGILRTIEKNFIVKAQEEDQNFLESTPEQTPIPTNAPPTFTPFPTQTPVSSATSSPSSTIIPATDAPIPQSGTSTPTFLITIFGILLIISGLTIAFII